MANTVEECDAMISTAIETETLLAVGHLQRYFDAYRMIKKMIEQKQLGRLCSITESRNIFYFNESRPKWFLNKESSGGGVVMNYGAHLLDKILYTTGASVEKVCANYNNVLNDADVEAAAQILLRLSNGVSVSLSYSGCHSPYMEEVVFYFTEGVAKVSDGRRLWISQKGKPFELVELNYEKIALEEQLAEFLKFINGEESEMVTAAYGREVIRVIEEVYKQV